MTRFYSSTLFGLFALAVSLTASPGCNIENCEEGAVCKDDDSDDNNTGDLCTSFCDRLQTCGAIGSSAKNACITECRAAVKKDPERATGGARCVIEDQCRLHYQCPGAPIPGGSSSGTSSSSNSGAGGSGASSGSATGGSGATGGSSTGGSGATGSGGEGGTSSCGDGPACVAPQECVNDACETPCTKSCQCAEGESCEAGYCGPANPPPACADDCDCPSGQSCVDAACVP